MADIPVKLMTQGQNGDPFYPMTHANCVLTSDGGNVETALAGKASKGEFAAPIAELQSNIRVYEAAEYESLKRQGALQDKLYFVLEEA